MRRLFNVIYLETVIVWSSYRLRKRRNFPAFAFRLYFVIHCKMSHKMLCNLGTICSKLSASNKRSGIICIAKKLTAFLTVNVLNAYDSLIQEKHCFRSV